MTRKEHLLWILAEECAEVAQRASKAARFGLDETEPGQPYTNAERICHEFFDLLAAVRMLEADGAIHPYPSKDRVQYKIDNKIANVEKFLNYSRECGTLHP